ncbi:hypothetical protein ACLKA7_014633 [Drosophila subpalustris]
MSSGSSTIDPTEFNEITDHNEAERTPMLDEDQDSPDPQSQPHSSSRRTITRRRRRRRRRRFHQPPPDVQLRIWVYERVMTRQHMNRIIFSIGRSLRSGRSLPAQPGRSRPAINYSRHGNIIIIDVQREQNV